MTELSVKDYIAYLAMFDEEKRLNLALAQMQDIETIKENASEEKMCNMMKCGNCFRSDCVCIQCACGCVKPAENTCDRCNRCDQKYGSKCCECIKCKTCELKNIKHDACKICKRCELTCCECLEHDEDQICNKQSREMVQNVFNRKRKRIEKSRKRNKKIKVLSTSI